MWSLLIQRTAAIVIATCLVGSSLMQPAFAEMISTETAIQLEDRQTRIDKINDVLAQENVQNMLVKMGVDPVDASQRVDSLTNEELQSLQDNLDQMPVGATGVVEVVGIVAIVLIVLELLNVTNFFTEF
ncbi:MAG: PA2779 family protein [Woeseiaceae bacterium]